MGVSAQIKHVMIDRRRIAYRDAGSGPVLFFLHGLGGNSASWAPQFAAFADTYRVVAWDMPGFGDSDFIVAPTTRNFSDLVRRFMDALGIEYVVGVGTSYGTVILADLAQVHPGRISAMVFACGVTGLGHLDPQESARLRQARRAELESMGQRKFAETRNSTYLAKEASSDLVAHIVALAGSATTDGYLQAYGALTESIIFPSLAAIEAPTLVLAGADDPIAPARDCERVALALPRAEYYCIPHAGHYLNLEQAEIFNQLIGEFLARLRENVPRAASLR